MALQGEQVDHRLALLRGHWKRHPHSAPRRASAPQAKQKSLAIAISREAGALGSLVAEAVGKRLSCPVYDREVIDEISKRARLRTELLDTIEEKNPNWLVETLTSLGHPGQLSSAGYAYHLPRVISALAEHGLCVIVGRGAAALLMPAKTLRVRLIASLDDRRQRMSELFGLTATEAQKATLEIDKKRANFFQVHFHKDISDPHEFDLVLNSSRLGVHGCVELIVSGLQAMEVSLQESS